MHRIPLPPAILLEARPTGAYGLRADPHARRTGEERPAQRGRALRVAFLRSGAYIYLPTPRARARIDALPQERDVSFVRAKRSRRRNRLVKTVMPLSWTHALAGLIGPGVSF